jgi:hypothetical protein
VIVSVDASFRVSVVASRVASYKADCELLVLYFWLEHPCALEGTPSLSSFILRTQSSWFENLTLFHSVLGLSLNYKMMQGLE